MASKNLRFASDDELSKAPKLSPQAAVVNMYAPPDTAAVPIPTQTRNPQLHQVAAGASSAVTYMPDQPQQDTGLDQLGKALQGLHAPLTNFIGEYAKADKLQQQAQATVDFHLGNQQKDQAAMAIDGVLRERGLPATGNPAYRAAYQQEQLTDAAFRLQQQMVLSYADNKDGIQAAEDPGAFNKWYDTAAQEVAKKMGINDPIALATGFLPHVEKAKEALWGTHLKNRLELRETERLLAYQNFTTPAIMDWAKGPITPESTTQMAEVLTGRSASMVRGRPAVDGSGGWVGGGVNGTKVVDMTAHAIYAAAKETGDPRVLNLLKEIRTDPSNPNTAIGNIARVAEQTAVLKRELYVRKYEDFSRKIHHEKLVREETARPLEMQATLAVLSGDLGTADRLQAQLATINPDSAHKVLSLSSAWIGRQNTNVIDRELSARFATQSAMGTMDTGEVADALRGRRILPNQADEWIQRNAKASEYGFVLRNPLVHETQKDMEEQLLGPPAMRTTARAATAQMKIDNYRMLMVDWAANYSKEHNGQPPSQAEMVTQAISLKNTFMKDVAEVKAATTPPPPQTKGKTAPIAPAPSVFEPINTKLIPQGFDTNVTPLWKSAQGFDFAYEEALRSGGQSGQAATLAERLGLTADELLTRQHALYPKSRVKLK